jgi:hypothetical protein
LFYCLYHDLNSEFGERVTLGLISLGWITMINSKAGKSIRKFSIYTSGVKSMNSVLYWFSRSLKSSVKNKYGVFVHIKGLLTELEVCTVKYQTEVF